MKDSMKALLEIDQRTNYISDKTIASRVFVHRHIRPRMKEIAFIVLGTVGKRMMLAANDMRDAMRAAFYMQPHPYIVVREQEDPHENLDVLLPYHEIPEAAYKEMITTPFLGSTLEAWSNTLTTDYLSGMATEYALGIAAGESIATMARRMGKQFDLPSYRSRAMARTAVQAAANRMQDRVYRANEHLISGYKFVATLDVRTCPECGGYDGNEYGKHEGRPSIPIHLQCRCNYTPVMKSAKELFGVDVEMSPGLRASMDGGVPAAVKWDKWIKRPENQEKLEAFLKAQRKKAYKKAKKKKKKKKALAKAKGD